MMLLPGKNRPVHDFRLFLAEKITLPMKKICFFLMFVILLAPSLKAQQFQGGLMGGLAVSTVAGDRSGGYNKFGLYGGGFVALQLNETGIFQMELAFFQKGAQSKGNPEENQPPHYLLRLNYVELPFVYQHRFGNFRAELGLSFDFLISDYEEVFSQPQVNDVWKKMTLNSVLGVKYDLNDRIALSLRKYNSINSIRHGTVTGNVWRYIKRNMGAFNDAYLFSVHYRL